MAKLNFCANISWLFKEANLLDRFQLAADAGFQSVEIAWPYDHSISELVKAKNDAKVDVVLINTGESVKMGHAANSNKKQNFKDELELAFTYAQALGCNNVHIMAGRVGSEQTKQQALDTFVENLKYAGQKLKEHGMCGVIEPINSRIIPDYFLSTTKQVKDILKLVDSLHIKYQLDIFHLQVQEGSITETIKEMFNEIGHIQISQVPNRGNPLSDGELNYSYIFNLLEKLNYKGWIGCEYKPEGCTLDSLEWFSNYIK